MINKTFEAIELALNDINPNAKKVIITSEGMSYAKGKVAVIVLESDFCIKDAIDLVGRINYIGIVNPEIFDQDKLVELVNILTKKHKATVVSVSTNPVSCKVFVPSPTIGTKYVDANYQYSYGQFYHREWQTQYHADGWGVRILDNSQTDYVSPLAMIKGHPVTDMTNLFFGHPATTLNLIHWDTSNITNMTRMFYVSKATNINGLSHFNTSNVTNMESMFESSKVTNLDLSSFNTSKAINMMGMFKSCEATKLDVSNFDTSKVTNMRLMFEDSKATNLDLSSLNTSKVYDMCRMFQNSKAISLDLSSFDTSYVADMDYMFAHSQATNIDLSSFNTSAVSNVTAMFYLCRATNLDLSSFDPSNGNQLELMFRKNQVVTIIAKTQADIDMYKFPYDSYPNITIIVKP